MDMRNLHPIFVVILMMTLLFSCSDELVDKEAETTEAVSTVLEVDAKSTSSNGVMMQAFYWDVPAGGNWWNTVKEKVPAWSNAGINAIWLPPASKAQNGGYSMGYDPFDYFDFGQYNQMGSIETRFGSKTELQSLIGVAHENNLNVFADIVLNHNSGGASESNIFTNSNTYTDYTPASGMFYRSQYDFHPNDFHNNDTGAFGGFADVCHHKGYVQDELWRNTNSVAKYYKNTMGFDGWRFDFVKGFEPWVIQEWNKSVGGFSVGELWDGNAQVLEDWVNASGSSAFDFACYYTMKDAFQNNNLTNLNGDMLIKRQPSKAVTFVANHDTDEIFNNKLLAYAYILTHEGYPTLFYSDYETNLDKNKLNNLIWIHNNLAGGSTSYLYADTDEYVARRNGYNNNGLVVYLNISNSWQERWIQTNWGSQRIKDYSGNSSWEPVVQSDGWVKIQVPSNGYSVWSIK
jgi:alpha-amylase